MLVQTDNINQNHVYIVPGCVYDPDTPLNILGIPALVSFFGDSADASNMLAADGTNIKSGANKSNFVWDHGKHERHFLHGSIKMPKLFLYVGMGILMHSVHVCIKFYQIRYTTPYRLHTPFNQLLLPRNLRICIS